MKFLVIAALLGSISYSDVQAINLKSMEVTGLNE
jgi:hypothetical protein